MKLLNIVGGTYFERCIEPKYEELFGSGLRAVLALANKGININFHSCISKEHIEYIEYLKNANHFTTDLHEIPKTIEWHYYHPLSPPLDFYFENIETDFKIINADNILYYGMHETRAKVHGDYVVYDPQNQVSLKATGSTYKHLALILNKTEALKLSCLKSTDLIEIGKDLLKTESAEVIVIKNGANGAIVFEGSDVTHIPIFETNNVWPIGTGDIFSAVFAWHWMINKTTSFAAALEASKSVAMYCESKILPLPESFRELIPLKETKSNKKIYLAGPFFSFGDRFTINEFRDALHSFGLVVYSPLHDGKIIDEYYTKDEASAVAKDDLKHIDDCDAILAIVTGLDAGTLFEIGYAKSKGLKIVVFCENVKPSDLVMLIGSDIEITDDFSTAVYKVSW